METENAQNTEEDTSTNMAIEENDKTEESGIDNDIEITEENNNEDIEEIKEECRNSNDEDDGDSEGWITPGNIKKVKRDMGYNDEMDIESANVQCACLTTDFAMQVYRISYLYF